MENKIRNESTYSIGPLSPIGEHTDTSNFKNDLMYLHSLSKFR